MGSASIFSQFMVLSGITEGVADFIIGLNLPRLIFVIIILVIYLIMGCFLDSISMLSITIPLFNPVLPKMGIDPFWYAMIVIMAIEIGMLTPPVGLCVYGAKAVAEPDVTLEDIFAGMMPFFWASLAALVIMVAFPGSVSFCLPDKMRKRDLSELPREQSRAVISAEGLLNERKKINPGRETTLPEFTRRDMCLAIIIRSEMRKSHGPKETGSFP